MRGLLVGQESVQETELFIKFSMSIKVTETAYGIEQHTIPGRVTR